MTVMYSTLLSIRDSVSFIATQPHPIIKGINRWVNVRPASNPEEDVSIILQNWDVESSHLIIGHCAVWKFHVNVPGWVGHDDSKLAQYGHVQLSQVTLHPLKHDSNGQHSISHALTVLLSDKFDKNQRAEMLPLCLTVWPVRLSSLLHEVTARSRKGPDESN